MTSVIFAPRVEDLTSDVEKIISNGYVQGRPSRVTTSGQWVMDDWSEAVDLTGAALTLLLDPLPGNPYELRWVYRDNEGEERTRSEFRIVVASGSPVKWEDLQLVGGPGDDAGVPSDIQSQLDAINARLDAVSGGASTLAAISDMSAPAKTFNAQASYTTMMSALGAAPLVSPALTGTPTAPTPTTGDNDTSIATTAFVQNSLGGSGLSFVNAALTGNPTAPTPTAGDNDTSIATTAFVTGALSTKANLNGSGLVDQSDIDPAIARLTDVTAVQVTWSTITGRPNVYVPHPCPGGVALARPNVPPGTVVVWIMSTIPPFGGVYMQVGDEWEERPDV